NSKDALNKGLLWFHDITDLEITPMKINSERNVLWQEILLKQGNDMEDYFIREKMNANLFPCRNDFSNIYKHYETYQSKDLINFYNTWYRPEKMAIVLVGNISNMNVLEEQIIKRFSNIKNDSPSKFLADCRLSYLKGGNRFILLQKKSNNDKRTKESTEF